MSELRKAADLAQSALAAWSVGEQLNATEINDLIERLGAALAQPEPEPVAYQWLGTSVIRKRIPKSAEADAWQPLYTAPPPVAPPHKRKPLTNADIKGIVDLGLQTWKLGESTYEFARAIERAHGIGVNK